MCMWCLSASVAFNDVVEETRSVILASGTLSPMASITGTVRKNDLEGGFWEIEAEDGSVYRLSGEVSGPGRFKVTGTIEKGGFGIHMSGPSLKIESIEPA